MTYARVLARRAGVASAAGVAAVLLLAGCGGDGGSGGGSSTPSPASSSGTGSGSTGSTGSSAAGSALVGNWVTTGKGSAVALVINGEKAALFTTKGTVCGGTAREEAGMKMIHLTCPDGNKDRAEGMVDSVGGTSMKITWESALGAETYLKAQGDGLPSGMPTAVLGS
ncbi:hypothetical protein [Streptomyces graminilatus]|uniref:hypothetical protein n=1 Tax=Streptomyces graminilatus TaxID=1464070 RepID=UPI0030CA3762